jgi:hypothetical protein
VRSLVTTRASDGERFAEDAFNRLEAACDAIRTGAEAVPIVRAVVDRGGREAGLTDVERQVTGGMCDIVTKAAFDLVRLAKLTDAAQGELRRG